MCSNEKAEPLRGWGSRERGWIKGMLNHFLLKKGTAESHSYVRLEMLRVSNEMVIVRAMCMLKQERPGSCLD